MNNQPLIFIKDRVTSRGRGILSGFDAPEKILLVAGIILLAVRFIQYPSVTHDEAARILTIQQTSFWDLIRLPWLDNVVHDPKG